MKLFPVASTLRRFGFIVIAVLVFSWAYKECHMSCLRSLYG